MRLKKRIALMMSCAMIAGCVPVMPVAASEAESSTVQSEAQATAKTAAVEPPSGTGGKSGQTVVTLKIERQSISADMVSFGAGQLDKDSIVVKDNGTLLTKDTDYTVEATDELITVKGTGSWKGTVSIPIPKVEKNGPLASTAITDDSVKDFIPKLIAIITRSETKKFLFDNLNLSSAVRTAIENGNADYEAWVNLQMTDVENQISEVDKDKMKNIASVIGSNVQIGKYLDFSMSLNYKITNKDADTQLQTGTVPLTEPTFETQIELTLPTDLQAPSGKVRKYYIIRLHNGVAEKIDTKLSGNTISFLSNKFSTYAIAYVDSDAPSTSSGGSSVSTRPTANPLTTVTADNGKVTFDKSEATSGTTVTATVLPDSGYVLDKLTIKDSTGKEIVLTSLGDNKYSFIMPAGKIEVSVTFKKEVEKPEDKEDITDTTKPASPIITEAQRLANSLKLSSKLKVKQSGKSLNVGWAKIAGADGYVVYAEYFGNSMDKIKVIKDANTISYKFSKLNGKALKEKGNYKVYVVAYKNVDGKKVRIGKSVVSYVAGSKSEKYTNAKSITLTKKSYTLTVGKKAQIKATMKLEDSSKKSLKASQVAKFRYLSSDSSVATVTSDGKIKAVGTGKCSVYVYAQNGLAKKITVTVK